jgi:AbrB family looped-hinge helix DNA binding protein
MIDHHKKKFYGVTTVGEKGQAVIPSEARKKMSLKTGDKLLVFSMGNEMLMLAKTSQIEKLMEHLSKKLESFQKIIQDNK